jgi:tricorn protease-like protein
MTGRNFAAAILLLLTLLSSASPVAGQENKPIIIETNSIVQTEPVWLDNNTLAYKDCSAIQMSPTRYVPGSVFHSKYDIAAGKEVRAKGEYGSLSQDKRFILSTERHGQMVIGRGMRDVMSYIKVIETESKAVKTDFSCPEEVQGASLSPDGQLIVFSKQGDLWRLRVGESSAQVVVETKDKERFPRHSPDGKKVYFIRESSDGTDLFALDIASNAVVQVSRGLSPVSAFSFSPDGKSIVFASTKELKAPSQDAGNIWLLDIESGKTKRLTDGGTDQHPSFSPNGQRIAFQKQQGFYGNSTIKAYQVLVIQPDLPVK